jgi:hypothetical protein
LQKLSELLENACNQHILINLHNAPALVCTRNPAHTTTHRKWLRRILSQACVDVPQRAGWLTPLDVQEAEALRHGRVPKRLAKESAIKPMTTSPKAELCTRSFHAQLPSTFSRMDLEALATWAKAECTEHILFREGEAPSFLCTRKHLATAASHRKWFRAACRKLGLDLGTRFPGWLTVVHDASAREACARKEREVPENVFGDVSKESNQNVCKENEDNVALEEGDLHTATVGRQENITPEPSKQKIIKAWPARPLTACAAGDARNAEAARHLSRKDGGDFAGNDKDGDIVQGPPQQVNKAWPSIVANDHALTDASAPVSHTAVASPSGGMSEAEETNSEWDEYEEEDSEEGLEEDEEENLEEDQQEDMAEENVHVAAPTLQELPTKAFVSPMQLENKVWHTECVQPKQHTSHVPAQMTPWRFPAQIPDPAQPSFIFAPTRERPFSPSRTTHETPQLMYRRCHPAQAAAGR